MCLAPQRRAIFRQFFDIFTSKSGPRVSVFYDFDFKMCFSPQRRAIFRRVLYILTSKCTSRYSGVQFFDIATSKSGPPMTCFVHFDFKMYFSLQRRAIFPHRNFKKWSPRLLFDPADTQIIEKHSISRLP